MAGRNLAVLPLGVSYAAAGGLLEPNSIAVACIVGFIATRNPTTMA